MGIVQVTVIVDEVTLTPVTVWVLSQPVVFVLSEVPVALLQVIPAAPSFVSVDPPSRKRTWMSESGGSVKVAVAPEPGRLVVQFVPLATVSPTLVWLAAP